MLTESAGGFDGKQITAIVSPARGDRRYASREWAGRGDVLRGKGKPRRTFGTQALLLNTVALHLKPFKDPNHPGRSSLSV